MYIYIYIYIYIYYIQGLLFLGATVVPNLVSLGFLKNVSLEMHRSNIYLGYANK